MRSVLSLTILFFIINPLFADVFLQPPQERAKFLIIKANEFDDPTTSLNYLNEAYQYIYDLEDSLEASLYLDLGTSHLLLFHNDSSNYFLNQALNLANKNSYKLIGIEALKKLGDVAKAENNYKQASEFYLHALEKERELFSSKTEDTNPSFVLNNNVVIGYIFTSIGIIFILIYANLRLQKRMEQKGFSNKAVHSRIVDSGKFSLPIKLLNQQLKHPLSQREYEVLCLTVTNNTNTLIAEQLFVSVNTVKTHLKRIFEKLDVTNRKEAIEKVINIKSEGLR